MILFIQNYFHAGDNNSRSMIDRVRTIYLSYALEDAGNIETVPMILNGERVTGAVEIVSKTFPLNVPFPRRILQIGMSFKSSIRFLSME